jgi:rhamnulokinase
VPVVAPACHDTASAIAAVPASGEDWAYISSGTWSLVGVEVREPIITQESLAGNFTNEGGVAGTFRFLKNVAGLWLLQECRRAWARQGEEYSYDELTQMAEAAPPFPALIDPDDPSFFNPADMPSAIAAYCVRSGQTPPQERGSIVRCALESLALKCRLTLDRIEKIRGRPVEVIHIVGGGARNRALCQFTADATARPVVAGPAEATATGNILVQALALGRLSSLEEGRAIVRRSFELPTYEPRHSAAWDEAYARFLSLLEKTGGTR